MRILDTKYLFTVSKSPLDKQVNGIVNSENHKVALRELSSNVAIKTF